MGGQHSEEWKVTNMAQIPIVVIRWWWGVIVGIDRSSVFSNAGFNEG